MSNPYRRPMRERVYKPLEFRSLTGEDVAEHYAELWQFALDDTGGVSESFSDIALRLRHGARAACKRLREERDEARQHFAEERETALEIRDEQRAAERERDAARLELRALEWLIVHHHDELRGLVLAAGDRANRYSYCARALGWEG